MKPSYLVTTDRGGYERIFKSHIRASKYALDTLKMTSAEWVMIDKRTRRGWEFWGIVHCDMAARMLAESYTW